MVPTRNWHQYSPHRPIQPALNRTPVSSVSNPDEGPRQQMQQTFTHSSSMSIIHSCTIKTFTQPLALSQQSQHHISQCSNQYSHSKQHSSSHISRYSIINKLSTVHSSNPHNNTTNIIAATLTEHHFLPAAGHVAANYSHRD